MTIPVHTVLTSLQQLSEIGCVQPVHLRAFIAWALNDVSVLKNIVKEVLELTGPSLTYKEIAAKSFTSQASLLDTEARMLLYEDLLWLKGRSYFVPNRPRGLESDVIALFGMALGIISLTDYELQDLKKWLDILCQRAFPEQTDEWDRSILIAVRTLIQENQVFEQVGLEFKIFLSSIGLMDISQDEQEKAYSEIVCNLDQPNGPARSSTQLASILWLLNNTSPISLSRPTPTEILKLLQGVSRSLRLWTWEDGPKTKKSLVAKWHIENEYHVQNLLWAILAPIFPDLENEENFPSLGHKHPRCDLVIPSLRLIIEVKFMRKGTSGDFSKMIEEIAADASLYLSDTSKYDRIIPFIWDNSVRHEEHGELIQGLNKIPGILGSVVISRPGKMPKGAEQSD
jgi:hypothetical protein